MMQMDPASAARHANGTFLNRHQGGAPASRGSLQHARWGNRHVPLQLHNRPANLLTGVLLLGSLGPGTGLPGPVAAGRRVAPGAADAAAAPVALLPAAQASGRYAPVAGPRQVPGCGRLGSIANGVAAACVARPRSCGGVMAVGAMAAVGGLAYARIAGATTVSDSPPSRRPASSAQKAAQEDALQAAVAEAKARVDDGGPIRLEDALLQIARDCDGDRACRAGMINALLQHVPPPSLARLRQIVARTAQAAETQGQAAWPMPGADAAPLNPTNAVQELVDILAGLYTLEAAEFQDDMEAIVGATASVGGGREGSDGEIQQRWIDANTRRQNAIADLLERHAGPVNRLPFPCRGLAHLGIADGAQATNLHVILPGASTERPPQRVLLVAHGDMIGRSLGSEGAYDNASGVATLLHIARQLQHAPSPPGTQVELLVTAHEELGFLGAIAYVTACQQQHNCPTFVINVDMTGRGGHGYAISGTDDLAGTPYLGKPPMYLQAPAVSRTEQEARRQLEAHFALQGFTAAPAAAKPWITSDNIPFQNASIPCVGITQISAADAHLWQQLENARRAWQQLDGEMDWDSWKAQRDGRIRLPADQARALQDRYQAVDAAHHDFMRLRASHPTAPTVLIHGPRDKLHRVSPAMGASFADALVGAVRSLQWPADGAAGTAAPLEN
ncbi:M28 family peptidase [Stenotrophomonas sp. Sa5BUN4]|uniref:M28 family peptidase n=1 Tax=Stenotrophomonas lacuserhaii TaxID=2760084 RepID=A0A8X8FM08_9GAMM|nr:M28 family peptidase [Stenotrophomonas pennii]MBD7954403.1 M28 family peptidase [Stenotrophomonas pennii]